MADMKLFCPNCGKSEKLFDGMCRNCFSKGISLRMKRNVFFSCKKCGKIINWNTLENAIKNNLQTSEKMKGMKITINNNRVVVDAKIEIKGNVFEKTLEGDVVIKKTLCERCSKIQSGYYECLVQLRDSSASLIENVENIDKSCISNIEKKPEGIDLFFISNSEAKKFVSELGRKFNIRPKETKSLIGQRDGKRIYRKTILLRLKS